MAVTLRPISSDPGQDLIRTIKDTFNDLVDQLNDRAQVYVSTTGTVPSGLNRNDVLIVDLKGQISILIKNAKGYDSLNAEMLGGFIGHGTQFVGVKSAFSAPTTAQFPNENDWGYFKQMTGLVVTNLFLCYNVAGVIRKVTLS